MGRNAAIKQYDATPDGQPMELFEQRPGRRPIIIELLRSPWLVRASELMRRDGACATRHTVQSIEVEWDAERRCPISFLREGRRYRVDAIVQVWAAERAWWDPRAHVSRRFWRVLARGGVYDLVYDRVTGSWSLIGIHD